MSQQPDSQNAANPPAITSVQVSNIQLIAGESQDNKSLGNADVNRVGRHTATVSAAVSASQINTVQGLNDFKF